MGCHFLLQGIFPTQGSNTALPKCRQTPYPLSHQGPPPTAMLHWMVHSPMARMISGQGWGFPCTAILSTESLNLHVPIFLSSLENNSIAAPTSSLVLLQRGYYEWEDLFSRTLRFYAYLFTPFNTMLTGLRIRSSSAR